MNQPGTKRPYRMGARAEAAARTGDAILSAAVELWRQMPLDQITLEAIGERAGVSSRTVIRRFGSRDGVIAACIATDAAGVRDRRDRAPAGDAAGALEALLEHYETDGDAILRTLALEGRLSMADAIVEKGRRMHREWCARVFAPHLPRPGDPARDARLDAFVAVTDVFVWKLLRRDLGRSIDETRQVVRILIDGLLGPSHS